MYKPSKRVLIEGLTTAIILSSVTIPTTMSSALGDFDDICISAKVEEYITESEEQDPVAVLVGEAPETATLSAAERVMAEKEKTKTEVVSKGKDEKASDKNSLCLPQNQH